MRIAVFLERSIYTGGGGGFQQALSTVVSLTRPGATTHDFMVFTQFEHTRRVLLEHGIKAIRFREFGLGSIDRWAATTVGGAILRRVRRLGFRRLGRHLDALLDEHGVDLALFTECGEIARRIGDHAFIITVWDLYHRDHPDFPDAYRNRLCERLERVHRATLTRALAVIANSPSGARRIASLYHVDPDRIIELPFLPSLAVRRHAAGSARTTADDVRHKYDLPARYVFYPAYFAAHKNHLYLMEGLIDLERRYGIRLHAAFCGGDAGNRIAVVRQVEALGLKPRVHFLGLVPDDDIPALYEGALALVMPDYCEPTNLPPLEAVSVGCPVVYADLPEFREQMGDAALYCDLSDVSSLADHLAAMIEDPALLDRLRTAGRTLAAEIVNIDYGERLKRVFDDYEFIRRRWAWPAA